MYSIPYYENSADIFQQFAMLPWAVFLDSCYPHYSDHFDIIAFKPKATLQSFLHHSIIQFSDGTSEISTVPPLELLKNFTLTHSLPSTKLPFIGGAIGYFSYDLMRTLYSIPTKNINAATLPLMQVGIYTTCIVIDHKKKQSWFITDSEKDFLDYLNCKDISEPIQNFHLIKKFTSDFTKEAYAHAFNQIKHHIYQGDCYQINLAQRFSASFVGSLWPVYCKLRAINPAPYAAYLNLPETTIMSFSPEQFLYCNENKVITKPIKGTRARSSNIAIDTRVKAELLNNEKDLAENIMIVDLLRNDLSKVCKYGTVKVPALFSLESFANVHHLVSEISGELAEKADAIDLLAACFPGGSITGTPKLRAMEIIEGLEFNRRNIYCGSIGYISSSGSMNLNIAIRTLYSYQNQLYCAAGSAIVADSNLDSEYQECWDKIKNILHFLETY